MKNLIKQKLYFALITLCIFSCKEGEFSNQSRELALVEYKANTRSFIPYYRVGIMGKADPPYDNTFGTYAGDDRGFSSKSNESAKLYQEVGFDLDKKGISLNAWCSVAKKYNSKNEFEDQAQGDASWKFTEETKAVKDGDSTTLTFATYVKAKNPLLTVSPKIEVFSNFSIEENKKKQYLKLKGRIIVDQFPSSEAYIKDPGGNIVLIGANPCQGGPINIWVGLSKEIEFDFKITIDSSGYFREVEENGWTQSISSWNSNFENKRAYN